MCLFAVIPSFMLVCMQNPSSCSSPGIVLLVSQSLKCTLTILDAYYAVLQTIILLLPTSLPLVPPWGKSLGISLPSTRQNTTIPVSSVGQEFASMVSCVARPLACATALNFCACAILRRTIFSDDGAFHGTGCSKSR